MAESSLEAILILSVSVFLGEVMSVLLPVTLFLPRGWVLPLLLGSSNTWASYSS